ncbi:MAG: serine protease, partial [Brevundimonas sp.]
MRLPDWLIYTLVALAVLGASLSRERAAAPPAPPPPDELEGALLGPVTPFDPTVIVDAPDTPFQP